MSNITMPDLTIEHVQTVLKTIQYPGFSRDIVSFGIIRDINIDRGTVFLKLEVTTSDNKVPSQIKSNIESVVSKLAGVQNVETSIILTQPQKAKTAGPIKPEGKPSSLTQVRYAIAVASGKGGVGKSTFAVNLSCALELLLNKNGQRKRVGLMDCDIYGPSAPLMIGAAGRPEIEGESIVPIENFGVIVMSMGFLVDEEAPVVWRGPMIMKTIQQFSTNVKWGELEFLVIDLPPGTGDAQLSLVQTIPLDGALVVTTPQRAAVNVATRGARMFEKVNIPLLGVAENMSYLLDPHTGEKNYIFGEDGGTLAAERLNTDFLGQVPLDTQIRLGCDLGIPIVISHPESESAKAFFCIAEKLMNKLKE